MQRKPLLAAFLSFFIPGLGQVYAGHLRRGIFCAALYFVSILVSMFLVVKLDFSLVTLFQFKTLGWFLGLFLAADAYQQARRVSTDFVPRAYNKWYGYIGFSVLVLLFNPAYIILFMIVGAVKVPTSSMQNTIIPGDRVIVDNLAYNLREPLWGTPLKRIGTPQRGDIITFRYPESSTMTQREKVIEFPEDPATIYLHRVVAIAGDTVETKGNQLIVNGEVVTEPYARYENGFSQSNDFGLLVVPVNQVFVMGDNRNNALDSRERGCVPLENILAQAKGVYWSEDASTGQIRWERIGKSLR